MKRAMNLPALMFAYGNPYGKLQFGGRGRRLGFMDTIEQPTIWLTTKRLTLEPIALADNAELLALWRDPEVRRYLWDNQIISAEQVARIQGQSDQCFAQYGTGLYTVVNNDAPAQLVGFCGFREFENGGLLELLYGMYPQYWGRGLITEAVAEVLRHGFDACGLERVIAATDTPNQPSVRVMQRLGMAFVERRRWHGLDTVFYTLSRADYVSR